MRIRIWRSFCDVTAAVLYTSFQRYRSSSRGSDRSRGDHGRLSLGVLDRDLAGRRRVGLQRVLPRREVLLRREHLVLPA